MKWSSADESTRDIIGRDGGHYGEDNEGSSRPVRSTCSERMPYREQLENNIDEELQEMKKATSKGRMRIWRARSLKI